MIKDKNYNHCKLQISQRITRRLNGSSKMAAALPPRHADNFGHGLPRANSSNDEPRIFFYRDGNYKFKKSNYRYIAPMETFLK